MRRTAVLIVAALSAALLLSSSPAPAGAGAGALAAVTIVHAATYSAEEDFPVTLCVDGEEVDGDFVVGEFIETELPAADYQVDIFTGTGQECIEGEGAISDLLSVPAGADVTVAAIWPSEGPTLAVWENDYSCTEPGEARTVVRHGATTNGPVDVLAIVDGEEIPVIENLAEGDQAFSTATVDYPPVDVAVVPAGGGEPFFTIPGATFDEGVMYETYVIGGNDGPTYFFVLTVDVGVCVQPVPPTPPAAAPAAAAPTFTG